MQLSFDDSCNKRDRELGDDNGKGLSTEGLQSIYVKIGEVSLTSIYLILIHFVCVQNVHSFPVLSLHLMQGRFSFIRIFTAIIIY